MLAIHIAKTWPIKLKPFSRGTLAKYCYWWLFLDRQCIMEYGG